MKILLAHNYYQSTSPSGEDAVFRNEVELLKKNDIEVVTYEKYNDEIANHSDKYRAAFTAVWSRRTYRELKALLAREKPDIAHFHNIFYLITPSAYYACREAGVPVIQTLHNFRFFCINGLLMRDGKVCEECIGKSPWRGVKYGCYRNSRIYSLPIAFADATHRSLKTWEKKIDAFIALTDFGRKKYVECGLPEEKIFVKPNFLPDLPVSLHKAVIPPDIPYAIFLGRMSAEKGLSVLINAFHHLSVLTPNPLPNTHNLFHLKIVGDGPLRENLQETVNAGKITEIEFTGRKTFPDAMELLCNSKFMIMPAIWYETFSLIGMEAFACGKPVIASRLGAMAELVEEGKTGLLFEPGNADDLASKIKWMLENEDACIEMGKNARKVFEEKYTAEKNYEILMKIYEKVIKDYGSKSKD
jgi:glycosyltransferase involved in cell wall biosynthesis